MATNRTVDCDKKILQRRDNKKSPEQSAMIAAPRRHQRDVFRRARNDSSAKSIREPVLPTNSVSAKIALIFTRLAFEH